MILPVFFGDCRSPSWLCREGAKHGTCQTGKARDNMIEVTKINGMKMLVNTSLIETVEETPDTMITLTSGKKLIVKESRQEVKELVRITRKDVFSNIHAEN